MNKNLKASPMMKKYFTERCVWWGKETQSKVIFNDQKIPSKSCALKWPEFYKPIYRFERIIFWDIIKSRVY